ncbi:MAG: hypothetical protein HN764_05515 [Gammaproteobacteria bacterium]|jgi:hypothetical protein|nr:hypothetical protein [Gammaproteobacteria bacterium]
MNTLKTKLLLLSAITFSMIAMQTTVLAENNEIIANWVLVGDSPLLDRSSKFLSNGYLDSGIKYAHKALARSQSKYVEVIARQNLCIAYAAKGQTNLATEHCALAESASMPMAMLKEIKPGLYKITRNKKVRADAITLEAVIAQNLENNKLSNDIPHLAQAN